MRLQELGASKVTTEVAVMGSYGRGVLREVVSAALPITSRVLFVPDVR